MEKRLERVPFVGFGLKKREAPRRGHKRYLGQNGTPMTKAQYDRYASVPENRVFALSDDEMRMVIARNQPKQ